MDISKMLGDLRNERERIDRAISALEGLEGSGETTTKARRGRPARTAPAKQAGTGRKRRLSAAGRKRISDMMKARWAERRRQQKAA